MNITAGDKLLCIETDADHRGIDFAKNTLRMKWHPKRRRWEKPLTPSLARLLVTNAAPPVAYGQEAVGDSLPREVWAAHAAWMNAWGEGRAESRTDLWGHQAQALHLVSWLPGVLLAIDMGCGKSRVIVEYARQHPEERILVLSPKSVLSVWEAEFEKWGYEGEVHVLRQASAKAKAHNVPFGCGAVVVNYDSAWREPLAAALEEWQPDVLVLDECLPTGSQIDTPLGPRAIEEIRKGEVVWGCDEWGRRVATTVQHTFKRTTSEPLVEVNGVPMTLNHPVWTRECGYVRALEAQGHLVLRYPHEHEAAEGDLPVQMVRGGLPPSSASSGVLYQELREQAHVCRAARLARALTDSDEGNLPAARSSGETSSAASQPSESPPRSQGAPQGGDRPEGARVCPSQWWQRAGVTDAAAITRGTAGLADRVRRFARASQEGLPIALQDRHRRADAEDRDRGGWGEPQDGENQEGRRKEGHVASGSRLERATVLESPCPRGHRGCRSRDHGDRAVYNLETETGNYFVQGLLVHNCQRAKSPSSRIFRWLRRFAPSVPKVVGLTGTPMPHGPLDIWSQMHAIDPGLLDPTYTQFERRHAIKGGWEGRQVVAYRDIEDDLAPRLALSTYQVRADDVLDLPPAQHIRYPVTLSQKAMKIYRELEEHYVAETEHGVLTAASAGVAVLRLQQLTGGMVVPDDDTGEVVPQRVDHAKSDALADLLEGLGRRPTVVFCRFRADLSEVWGACRNLGLTYSELSGSENTLAEWQAGETQVIAVQVQAGGLGVDLSRAGVAIYYSLGWSLGDYLQSLARLRRPAQQAERIVYYHLVAAGTIDETVYRALEKKEDIVEAVYARWKNG